MQTIPVLFQAGVAKVHYAGSELSPADRTGNQIRDAIAFESTALAPQFCYIAVEFGEQIRVYWGAPDLR
jgi:hypothetical protein